MTIYKDAFGYNTKQVPELNYDLLTEAVSWAYWSAHADLEAQAKLGYYWDQSSWVTARGSAMHNQNECATSYCIAGYATMAAGHTALKNWCTCCESTSEYCTCADEGCCVPSFAMMPLPVRVQEVLPKTSYWYANGEECMDSYSEMGQHLLGLTDVESGRLFDGDNTIEAVIEFANTIAAHRGYPEIDVHAWEMHYEGEKAWLTRVETPEAEQTEAEVVPLFAGAEWESTFTRAYTPEVIA